MPEPVDPGPETQPSLEARPGPDTQPSREPVDPGPDTEPSPEARPGPDTQPSPEARPEPLERPAAHTHRRKAHRKRVPAHAGAPARTESPPEDVQRSEPVPLPAQPVVVRGQYHYLKRRTFVLVVIGVWIPAAVIGLALYYWWFHSPHKTPAVLVVLMFIVVCTVAAQLLSMVEHKPLVTAVSIALLSAPFAATAAAAALYGAYAFHWIPR